MFLARSPRRLTPELNMSKFWSCCLTICCEENRPTHSCVSFVRYAVRFYQVQSLPVFVAAGC
jgi:hypothetical protein